MRRNLDLTALRAFVTVADTGGVTRAAGVLNLTQSAVSMQLKRLEESLGIALMDRSGRGIGLTAPGEQLLSYARRMIALNDEAVGRMTAEEFEGQIILGVPHDIVSSFIPKVLKQFAAAFPRMRIQFITDSTLELLEKFQRGEVDVIVTTEQGCGPEGETLAEVPLVWVGALGGRAWKQSPLPFASEGRCIFRPHTQRALDAAGVPWVLAVDSNSTRTIEATVQADLAVHAVLDGMWASGMEPVDHGGALPDLRSYSINLYQNPASSGAAEDALADMLREVYRDIVNPSVRRPSPLSVAS